MKKLLLATTISALAGSALAGSYTNPENKVDLSTQESALISAVTDMNQLPAISNTLSTMQGAENNDGKMLASKLAVLRYDATGIELAEEIVSGMSGAQQLFPREVDEILNALANAPLEIFNNQFQVVSLINELGTDPGAPVTSKTLEAATTVLNRLGEASKYSESYLSNSFELAQLESIANVLLERISNGQYDFQLMSQEDRTFLYSQLPSLMKAFSTMNYELQGIFYFQGLLEALDWNDIRTMPTTVKSDIVDALLEGLITESVGHFNHIYERTSDTRGLNGAQKQLRTFIINDGNFSGIIDLIGERIGSERSFSLMETLIDQLAADFMKSGDQITDNGSSLILLDELLSSPMVEVSNYYPALLKMLRDISENTEERYLSQSMTFKLNDFFDRQFSAQAGLQYWAMNNPIRNGSLVSPLRSMLFGSHSLLITPTSYIQALNSTDTTNLLQAFVLGKPANQPLDNNRFAEMLDLVVLDPIAEQQLFDAITSKSNIDDYDRHLLNKTANSVDPVHVEETFDRLVTESMYDMAVEVQNASNQNLKYKVDMDKFGTGSSQRITHAGLDGYVGRRLKNSNHHWTVSMPMLDSAPSMYQVSVSSLTRTTHCGAAKYTVNGSNTAEVNIAHNGQSSGGGTIELDLGMFELSKSSTITVSGENCGTKQVWLDNFVLEKI